MTVQTDMPPTREQRQRREYVTERGLTLYSTGRFDSRKVAENRAAAEWDALQLKKQPPELPQTCD